MLVLTRSSTDPTRPNGFDFPGGEIEFGEDLKTGAAREMLEEAGIQVAADNLQMIYTNASDKDERGNVCLRFLYIARITGEPPVILSHEHSKYEWLDFNRVLEVFESVSWATGLRFAIKNGLISNNNLQ